MVDCDDTADTLDAYRGAVYDGCTKLGCEVVVDDGWCGSVIELCDEVGFEVGRWADEGDGMEAEFVIAGLVGCGRFDIGRVDGEVGKVGKVDQ